MYRAKENTKSNLARHTQNLLNRLAVFGAVVVEAKLKSVWYREAK